MNMPTPDASKPPMSRGRFAAAVAGTALVTALLTALLASIFEHKQEAKNPYLRFVDVTEETTDPAPWGVNWPREYDTYKLTSTTSSTKFGGHGGSDGMPRQKAEENPWLSRAFAGYAFALDYRDRRGHAYMLADQEAT
jgi:nitrite reductase (cytochrome c-552)